MRALCASKKTQSLQTKQPNGFTIRNIRYAGMVGTQLGCDPALRSDALSHVSAAHDGDQYLQIPINGC